MWLINATSKATGKPTNESTEILNRLIPGTGVRGKRKMMKHSDVQWLLDQSVVLYKEMKKIDKISDDFSCK